MSSFGRSLRRSMTYFTGLSQAKYNKYSDFKDLTPEEILNVPLDQISSTKLENDTTSHGLDHAQLYAVSYLKIWKKAKKTPTQDMIDQAFSRINGTDSTSRQVSDLLVNFDREKRKKDDLTLRHKRLKNTPLTVEEELDLRLNDLDRKGGKRNAKKTKKQNKKRTNQKKNKTYKK